MELINLKKFAEERGMSYDAVRKQIQRIKPLIINNIFKKGRNLVLDEKAVEILDLNRKKPKKRLITKDEEISKLKMENSILKDRIIDLQNELINKVVNLQERLIELDKKVVNTLEAKQKHSLLGLFKSKLNK